MLPMAARGTKSLLDKAFRFELDNLVKAIGECKSKAEEDRIITQELEVLKQRLNDPKLDKSRGREYMVRVMYCEMLGHDASFAYIHCLQFASDPNIHTKKAAYLALTQLMDYNSELVLLLVNTLLSDLKSDNYIIVTTALTVATKLIGPDLVSALLPVVLERLNHPKEAVRKKAILALQHFHRLDPQHAGPLAGVDLDRYLRTALCDKDPGVMAASLCLLQEVSIRDPAPYRALIPSLTSILKQVCEHRLPKSYDYHRFPAPFIQLKLLRTLAQLGTGDKTASDNMAAVVGTVLRRAGGGHAIGNAIVYEAVKTITAIYPNPALLGAAAEAVAVLLRSASHNLKYCGLDALASITRISPKYAAEHQVAVIDCLEDPDDSLKLKTLELLATMTKANNVEVIVERLMLYLRSCSDEHVRRHIAEQVAALAEKYAPNPAWFVGVMAEVFELGGDALDPGLAHSLMGLVAEQDAELQSTAVAIFLALLERRGAQRLPQVLLHTLCWVLGEYGGLAQQLEGQQRATVPQVIERLVAAVGASQPSPSTRAYLVTAITKLSAMAGCALPCDAEELVRKAASSASVELQQRAYEAQELLSGPASLAAEVLPFDGSCEELEPGELDEVRRLSFLSDYIQQALAAGAAPYAAPAALGEEDEAALLAGLGVGGDAGARHGQGGLRFEAYEPAPAPAAGSLVGADLLGVGPAVLPQAAALPHALSAAAAAPPPGPGLPQLTLKAAGGPRRWGAEAAWGGAPVSSTNARSPAAGTGPAAAGPAAAAPAKPAVSQAQQPRVTSEKERLAASIFGGAGSGAGGGASGARVGVRAGAEPAARSSPRTAQPSPVQAPLVGDLISGDDGVAAPAATPAALTSDLDLLLGLRAEPEHAVAAGNGALGAVAGSAAPAAAVSNLLDLGDLLGGQAPAPPRQASPSPLGALPAAGGVMFSSGAPAAAVAGTLPLQMLQMPRSAPSQPLGAMGAAPTKPKTIDPFSDLFS